MEMMMMFRIAAIFLGLIIGLLSYRIFVLTKGSSKGWSYLAWAGIILSLWAIIQTILIEKAIVVNISSLIGFLAIGILLPLALITLDRDFGMNLCNLFCIKWTTAFYAAGWVILLVLNFLILEPTRTMPELAGISHLMLAIMALYTVYPAVKMWRQTGKWFWLLIFLFIAMVGISVLAGAYTAGGCEQMPTELEACEGFSTHYAEVVPMPYPPSLISLTAYYHALLLPGLVIGAIGFFGIWRRLG